MSGRADVLMFAALVFACGPGKDTRLVSVSPQRFGVGRGKPDNPAARAASKAEALAEEQGEHNPVLNTLAGAPESLLVKRVVSSSTP